MKKFFMILFVLLAVQAAFAQATLFSVGSGTTNSNICAGALASAYGSFPGVAAQSANQLTNVSGLQMRVNGVNAPMSYVSAGQINFQIPYGVTGTATFQVVRTGGSSQTISRGLSVACLGGMPFNGQPLVTNAITGAVVSSTQPVPSGTFLTVWVAGGGQTNPAQSTGVPASGIAWYQYPVSITCTNGCFSGPIQMQYAGAAPGYVGLGQITFVVPPASPGMRHFSFQSVGSGQQNISGSNFNLFVTVQ